MLIEAAKIGGPFNPFETVGDVADHTAQFLGVGVVLTPFVETGLILYLPIPMQCKDGLTRGPGLYVNPDAGRTKIGGKAFPQYGR